MRLIDADALKKDWSMANKCEECSQDARKCQYEQNFSRMDICEMLDEAPTVGGWISAKDRLPETGASVLVCVKPREKKPFICMAAHVGAREVNSESYGWEDAEVNWDYEEDTDTYWIPECWYEMNLVEDNTNWIIDEYADGVVTHWMPLPEPPKEEGTE